MPVVDNLESKPTKDADGNEVQNWFLLRNPQFRHLNLCLNQLDEFCVPQIEEVLKLTPEDFCFTLSGNAFPEESVEKLQALVKSLHKTRVTEQRLAEPGTPVHEIADIAQRRTAF